MPLFRKKGPTIEDVLFGEQEPYFARVMARTIHEMVSEKNLTKRISFDNAEALQKMIQCWAKKYIDDPDQCRTKALPIAIWLNSL